ncbi:MAG: HD domain-containing protein [Trueperaceae bacterium]|nr:HD domain-containing protein [Trueperaceae bacterium]
MSALRFARENRLLFVALVASCLLFAVVLVAAWRQAWQAEQLRSEQAVNTTLASMRGTLEEFTRNVEAELRLFAGLPDTRTFVANGFAPGEAERRLQQTFVRALETRSSLKRLRVLDASGLEHLRVERRTGPDGREQVWVVPDDALTSRSDRDYVAGALGLEPGALYVSPLDLAAASDAPDPVVQVATLLGTDDAVGIIVMDIAFAEILALLPTATRIYTPQGLLLTSDADGRVVIREAALPPLPASDAIDATPRRWSQDGLVYTRFDYATERWLLLALPGAVAITDWGATSLLLTSGLFLLSMLTLGFIIYQRYKQTLLAQRALTYALVTLVEGRDQETGLHLERTRRYATILATTMRSEGLYDDQLNQRFIDQLGEAALLHDIGKVTIPDAILQKPGALDDHEFETMKKHVEIGSEMIKQLIARYQLSYRWLPMAQNICAYHHERYDGSGYQQGLSGQDIPLEARIFAVCDVYDALRAKRSYKEPMPHRVSVAKIVEESGRHFDPLVVAGLQRCESEFARIHDRLADEEAQRLEPLLDIDAEGVWPSS